MAFSYLNYARYGIAKLAGLTRLSKAVCEGRGNFMKFPQDMIDYYNSVSKIIYGSDAVTDVTSVGDKNGFRAMSTAKTESLLKFLATYNPPIDTHKVGRVAHLAITGLNIDLNGWIEDQNRMKIETTVINTFKGKFMVSVSYIPAIRVIVSVLAMRIGPGDPENIRIISIPPAGDLIGMGRLSDMYVYVTDVAPNAIGFCFESFLANGAGAMIPTYSGTTNCWLHGTARAIAQQPHFLYFSTTILSLTVGTFPTGSSSLNDRSHITDDDTTKHGWTEYSNEHTEYSDDSSYQLDSSSQGFRDGTLTVPEAYEVAMNDVTAIHLMYLLINDILTEINQA